MENSPPGIQAIPSCAPAGAGTVLGMVGMKFSVAGGSPGMDAVAIGMAFGECLDAVFQTAVPTGSARIAAPRRKMTRVVETSCERLLALPSLPIADAFSHNEHFCDQLRN